MWYIYQFFSFVAFGICVIVKKGSLLWDYEIVYFSIFFQYFVVFISCLYHWLSGNYCVIRCKVWIQFYFSDIAVVLHQYHVFFFYLRFYLLFIKSIHSANADYVSGIAVVTGNSAGHKTCRMFCPWSAYILMEQRALKIPKWHMIGLLLSTKEKIREKREQISKGNMPMLF